MIKIPLTQGKFAIIDDEDFEKVSKFKWVASTVGQMRSHTYASTKSKTTSFKTLLMHRLILQAPKGVLVDHIDRDCLNNQKYNLRICTPAQNQANSKLISTNKSGYRGVCWSPPHEKFRAYISINDRTIHIGLYPTAREAAIARNIKSQSVRGEFAVLNIIPA